METINVLTMAGCLACTIGPLIGLATLAVYRGLRHIDRRGFEVTAVWPGEGDLHE